MNDWHPTIAHFRAAFTCVALAAAAVVWRRADLLVLASPLAAIAVWSTTTRPAREPTLSNRLEHATLREGEATTWTVGIAADNRAEHLAAVVTPGPWAVTRPACGVLTAPLRPARMSSASVTATELDFTIRMIRWGRQVIGPTTVAATSSWGAYRWMRIVGETGVTVLPIPALFDSSTTGQRADGLVGLHRSARQGDGSEFAGIRPFQVGDRLRRIHWARSLRTGALHVTSTWAEQDRHVVLVVDALDDLGVSEGIDGRASSLDLTVRAAGAIAEHFGQRGDRVSLRILGSTSAPVPPATGRAHLRRILETLARIRAEDLHAAAGNGDRLAMPPDAVIVMLSPLISAVALERAVTFARHGLTVVVVDTLPDHVVDDDDPVTALTWRIRLLERRREMRIVQEIGVPVVRWNGAGSLDQFLRDAARRAHAPRLARR